MTPVINKLAAQVGNELLKRNLKLSVAESCTGGGLSYAITSIPGSSNWFDCGFITYSDHAKIETLGVNPLTIKAYGAVSEHTACEMAVCAVNKSEAYLAAAITGIAGPTGGSPLKPIGSVWIASVQRNAAPQAALFVFSGDRESIRLQAIEATLKNILEIAKNL